MGKGKASAFKCMDFNVPIEDGKVLDDGRLRTTLLTIRSLTQRGAKVVFVVSGGSLKRVVINGERDPNRGSGIPPLGEII